MQCFETLPCLLVVSERASSPVMVSQDGRAWWEKAMFEMNAKSKQKKVGGSLGRQKWRRRRRRRMRWLGKVMEGCAGMYVCMYVRLAVLVELSVCPSQGILVTVRTLVAGKTGRTNHFTEPLQ
ncbi:hypothetical protein LY76DRAFT_390595 [Colletotrichum caudatum]|nr:hypothetical protein LY76DRAFT_390595 [Colletotrichum caudatum]